MRERNANRSNADDDDDSIVDLIKVKEIWAHGFTPHLVINATASDHMHINKGKHIENR